MKKSKRSHTSLLNRFCHRFSPQFLEQIGFHADAFWEGFISVITFGVYQPDLKKKYEESYKKTQATPYTPCAKKTIVQSIQSDISAVMGDIAKGVNQVCQENPELVRQFERQMHSPEVQAQMTQVKQKTEQVAQRMNALRQKIATSRCDNHDVRMGQEKQAYHE